MKFDGFQRVVRQPEVRRNLLLAGGLAVVVAVYLLVQQAAPSAAQPPAPPHRELTPVAERPAAEDGYFLKEYDAGAPASLNQSGWTLLADVGVKLAIVLGLIYGAARLLRRYGAATRFGVPVSGKAIRVLETTHLAPNRSLYLISVGSKVLLLGATAAQLSTLTELADPAEVAGLRGDPPPPSSFERQLEAALVDEAPATTELRVAPDPVAEGRDFLEQKIAQIREITSGLRRS